MCVFVLPVLSCNTLEVVQPRDAREAEKKVDGS